MKDNREKTKNKWVGKRAIIVGRQSNDKDGAASTAAQIDFISKNVIEAGMTVVDHEKLEGVTGSLPGRREDLERLLKRRREKGDFDVIAVQLTDRLTRGGGEHGMWFEHECKRNGVRLYFAGEQEITGAYASMIKVAKYDAAQQYSIDTGRRSTQGRVNAQKAGMIQTTGPTPLGCHRIYLGEDGKPHCIIRNLVDGRQEQLDPETRQVIGRFGTVGKKSKNRFKKQKNEYSLLVPGEREQTRVVRVIFFLRFKRGWRGARITEFLNANRIPSPKGGDWSPRQVESIYENEAYTGFTFNNQTFSGRFVRADQDRGYVDLDRDECELVTAKTFTPVFLPFDDWQRIDQPFMHDFLPSDVRALAIEDHAAMSRKRLDPTQKTVRLQTSRPGSDYLLSNKLIAVQDSGRLTGTLTGPKDGKKTEYYRHQKARKGRMKKSVYNRLIPAQPLHRELIRWVREAMLAAPDLRDTLTAIVTEHRQRSQDETVATDDLEQQRAAIDEQINTIVRSLSGAALKVAQADLERLGQRRNDIEVQLIEQRRSRSVKQKPVEQVVEQAVRRLQRFGEKVEQFAIEPLRRLVDQIVLAARVDMETKRVEFDIALPKWALERKNKVGTMCPDTSSWSQGGHRTHGALVTLDCEYRHTPGSTTVPGCYACRRKAA